jgi:DNA-binding MarR family transcriptional regulator
LLGTERLETWKRFLRAHAAITRRLSADLTAKHGLTVHDYEVMLHLAHAEHRVLRRVDLAERLLLTPSGITRLLDGLERAGLVERASCSSDARVVYARLTDAGYERLREASATHLAGVDDLFLGRFGADELENLSDLLGRLTDGGDDALNCSVD